MFYRTSPVFNRYLLNSYGHHIELLDTDDVDLRSEAKTATESEDENVEQCEQNSFEHDEV